MVIRVPEAVRAGETVTLSCQYDLEDVALYSIKWYWNEEEFYRFIPKDLPPYKSFPMRFINVDVSSSKTALFQPQKPPGISTNLSQSMDRGALYQHGNALIIQVNMPRAGLIGMQQRLSIGTEISHSSLTHGLGSLLALGAVLPHSPCLCVQGVFENSPKHPQMAGLPSGEHEFVGFEVGQLSKPIYSKMGPDSANLPPVL